MAGRRGSETGIDEMLITRLLEEQAPRPAGLRAVKVRDGWDNAVWRLGDSLAIRITRRAVAAGLHLHEQRWLPVLAPRLLLPVPAPVIAGVPSARFPWPWSVVPWFEGDVAAVAPPLPREAGALGAFLAALHVPAPEDVAPNPARGGPLASCQAAVTMWAEQPLTSGDEPLIREAAGIFNAGLLAATATERVWIHGDLHPRNVLVSQGRLCAVLDWGDVTAGDAAADLAALWWLFDLNAHGEFWTAYRPVSPAMWHRARAWAALFGLSFLSFGSQATRQPPIPRHTSLGDASSVALWQNNDRHLDHGGTATGAQTGLSQQERPGQRLRGTAPPHHGAESRPERADLQSMQRQRRSRRGGNIRRSARVCAVGWDGM